MSIGSAVSWVALFAMRKWTREVRLNQTVIGLWVVAVILIGLAFFGPSKENKPGTIPIKTKRG